jgi:hypothetical protein
MSIRLVLGPTQSPIQWVPGGLTPGVKWTENEPDRIPPSNAEVKNTWIYIYPLPHTCLWHNAESVVHRDDFTLLFEPVPLVHRDILLVLSTHIFGYTVFICVRPSGMQ